MFVDFNGVFINRDMKEKLAWSLFMEPLSPEFWITMAAQVALLIFLIWIFNVVQRKRFTVFEITQYPVVLFSAYFGKKFHIEHRTDQIKPLLFGFAICSTVVWISYRASLTSKLSIRDTKLPFTSLEELLETDYK